MCVPLHIQARPSEPLKRFEYLNSVTVKTKIGIQISAVTWYFFLLRAKTAAHCTCTRSWKQHFYSCKLGCSHQASEKSALRTSITRFLPVRTYHCLHFHTHTHTWDEWREKCFKKYSKRSYQIGRQKTTKNYYIYIAAGGHLLKTLRLSNSWGIKFPMLRILQYQEKNSIVLKVWLHLFV